MDMKSGSTPSTLVILPGLMCDSRMFAAQIAAFPGARVIDGFYDGADRFESMADYALARMPARASLLGHSMGARLALEIYRKAPERIERIALADTGIHPVHPGEQDGRYALRDVGRKRGFAALVDQWLPPMVSASRRQEEALMGMLRAMCIDAGQAVYEAQIEALLHRRAVDDLLTGITCPALAVTGREDAWSPPAQHEAIAAAIPGCQLRVIDGAGHMAPAEKPGAFNAILREWLNIPASH